MLTISPGAMAPITALAAFTTVAPARMDPTESGVSVRMRLLAESATQILPLKSITRSAGAVKSPHDDKPPPPEDPPTPRPSTGVHTPAAAQRPTLFVPHSALHTSP